MPMVTTQLTSEQIDQFRTEGFLCLEALTTAEEVAWIREIYDRLFEQRAGREQGFHYDLAGHDDDNAVARLPQILKPALREFAPELSKSALLENATRIGQQMLGPDCLCEVQHAILKPAGYGSAAPWHQDSAYMGGEHLRQTFAFWVPLQEATIDNGCMQFVPRSHKSGTFDHQSMNGDPRITALELVPEMTDRVVDPVPCPIPAGGATLHDAYTLHYTGPNTSDVDRRALILKAQIEGMPAANPRVFPWIEAWETARMKRAQQQSG